MGRSLFCRRLYAKLLVAKDRRKLFRNLIWSHVTVDGELIQFAYAGLKAPTLGRGTILVVEEFGEGHIIHDTE